MHKKYTYDYVKNKFSDHGFTLISDKYEGARIPLEFVCNSGHIRKMSLDNLNKGTRCLDCSKEVTVKNKNISFYATLAPSLEKYHNVYLITKNKLKLLGVECLYCNKIFSPKKGDVYNRLSVITGKKRGDHHFYCSLECKKVCPTFNQTLYPKDFANTTSREVQPELRKLVLQRDNWICKKCKSTESGLHCHHITPVINNPIESADIDNCITLCKDCHIQVHKLPGCGYRELTCI